MVRPPDTRLHDRPAASGRRDARARAKPAGTGDAVHLGVRRPPVRHDRRTDRPQAGADRDRAAVLRLLGLSGLAQNLTRLAIARALLELDMGGE